MPPAEVELLVADLRGELVPLDESAGARAQLARYHWLLQGFCFDWRHLYALHGEGEPAGAVRGSPRKAARRIADAR